MTSHHLVSADTFQDGVHDWPLRSCLLPTIVGLLFRQLHHFCQTCIEMQVAPGDVDTAPDNPARLTDTLAGASTQTKIHRRLPFAGSTSVPADEMCWRSGAADQENPDIVIDVIVFEMTAPP